MKGLNKGRLTLLSAGLLITLIGYIYLSGISFPDPTSDLISWKLSQIKIAEALIAAGTFLAVAPIVLMITNSEMREQRKLFLAALCGCELIVIYCIANGQLMSSMHLESQYLLRDLQITGAVIIVMVVLFKQSVKNKSGWLFIPTLLVGYAFLYVFIVNQFPCCIGG